MKKIINIRVIPIRKLLFDCSFIEWKFFVMNKKFTWLLQLTNIKLIELK